MDTFGKYILSGSVLVWDPLGIFLYVPTNLLDQVLVCLLAPGFIAMALYSHQDPYFCQIRSYFTLCTPHSASIVAKRFLNRMIQDVPCAEQKYSKWTLRLSFPWQSQGMTTVIEKKKINVFLLTLSNAEIQRQKLQSKYKRSWSWFFEDISWSIESIEHQRPHLLRPWTV